MPSNMSRSTQFLGFGMNCLAVMNIRQATRVELTWIWCFSCSGRILIGKKLSSNWLWMIGSYTYLKILEFAELNWMNSYEHILGFGKLGKLRLLVLGLELRW